MHKYNKSKKHISLFLALSLTLIPTLTSCSSSKSTVDEDTSSSQGQVITETGAVDVKANTLRLLSFDGDISIKNATGSDISPSENMKLQNGYEITTDANSYAYVSLDDDKAIKLDGLTSFSVKQIGEKLEVLLNYGQLFFNVTKPLQDSETMNIRTSNMITGIRGTSGYATTRVSQGTQDSSMTILDGKVELTFIGDDDTTKVMEEVSAGQTAFHISDDTGSTEDFYFLGKEESEIPRFVVQEVAQDTTLQEKIQAEEAFSVPAILNLTDDDYLEEIEEQEDLKEQEEELISQIADDDDGDDDDLDDEEEQGLRDQIFTPSDEDLEDLEDDDTDEEDTDQEGQAESEEAIAPTATTPPTTPTAPTQTEDDVEDEDNTEDQVEEDVEEEEEDQGYQPNEDDDDENHGTSGGSDNDDSDDDTEEEDSDEIQLSGDITSVQINDAFSLSTINKVLIDGISNITNLGTSITVPTGKTLLVNPNAQVTVSNGTDLNIDGTVTVSAGAQLTGADTTLNVNSINTLNIDGIVEVGELHVGALGDGRVVVEGELTTTTASITGEGSTIIVAGQFTTDSLDLESSGTVTNNGTLSVKESLTTNEKSSGYNLINNSNLVLGESSGGIIVDNAGSVNSSSGTVDFLGTLQSANNDLQQFIFNKTQTITSSSALLSTLKAEHATGNTYHVTFDSAMEQIEGTATIKPMADNLTIGDSLQVNSNEDIILDLEGRTLFLPNIVIADGELEIRNGTVNEQGNTTSDFISVNDGVINLKSGNVNTTQNTSNAVSLSDTAEASIENSIVSSVSTLANVYAVDRADSAVLDVNLDNSQIRGKSGIVVKGRESIIDSDGWYQYTRTGTIVYEDTTRDEFLQMINSNLVKDIRFTVDTNFSFTSGFTIPENISLNIEAGNTVNFSVPANTQIYIGSDITGTGMLKSTSGIINFNGSGPQSVEVDLEVNKVITSGNVVTVGSGITVKTYQLITNTGSSYINDGTLEILDGQMFSIVNDGHFDTGIYVIYGDSGIFIDNGTLGSGASQNALGTNGGSYSPPVGSTTVNSLQATFSYNDGSNDRVAYTNDISTAISLVKDNGYISFMRDYTSAENLNIVKNITLKSEAGNTVSFNSITVDGVDSTEPTLTLEDIELHSVVILGEEATLNVKGTGQLIGDGDYLVRLNNLSNLVIEDGGLVDYTGSTNALDLIGHLANIDIQGSGRITALSLEGLTSTTDDQATITGWGYIVDNQANAVSIVKP